MNDVNVARYRPWFYAAAVYNLVWGAVNVLVPTVYLNLLGVPIPTDMAYWRVVGMFVLVYAPAYWWAGRFPQRYPHFILIGLVGKLFGPLGFVGSVMTGSLPLAFGLIILTNDLIWWPAFGAYLYEIVPARGGWRKFLLGE
ncbi:MAG TPA: alkyl hydroperoxide reductase [Anaerolineae bacterium]|nr:alkyl hydroperoxide reductase [Anaerolineae bacterium]